MARASFLQYKQFLRGDGFDVTRRWTLQVDPNPLCLTTWNRRRGIRFYGGDFGELAWGASTEPTETFHVVELGPGAP